MATVQRAKRLRGMRWIALLGSCLLIRGAIAGPLGKSDARGLTTVEIADPSPPPDVAALVDKVTPDGVSVQLVNLHPSEPRDVILQAGAFGEHDFTTASHKHQTVQVGRNRVRVRLLPGAMGRLDLGMKRYVHAPSY